MSISYQSVRLVCFLLCWVFYKSYAQDGGLQMDRLNNVREDVFLADTSFVHLDTMGILPTTLLLKIDGTDTIIPRNDYYIDPFNGLLKLTNPSWKGRNLRAYYRVLPNQIQMVYRKKKFGGYTWRDTSFVHPMFYDPNYGVQENVIDFGGLNYNGAFARGISFGNNQDVVVNSTLDLQLSGKIGNLEILAALTDNTIPIQPDGTTEQIQDLDKVYIQVSEGKHKFVAGDYGIQSRDGYFIKFDKQLQGASFSTGFDLKKGWSTKHSFSFAVAKGKFTRNTFDGQEGNQGPYKLTGNNGETYIIILAGSERVYADGQLLTRGENDDYTMDYNTGELTFTPNFMITKDIRLVVEFEYSDKNYFRTLFHTAQEVRYKGLRLYAQFYSEQDSKNKPILSEIDSTSEQILKQIGNHIDQAVVPGFHPTDYTNKEILYGLKDSLINGVLYDSIFYYTTRNDIQLYRLKMSFVGAGKGDYVPDKNTLNQRVYRWVAPINGVRQGAYAPVELIITPKKDQYAVLGAEYQINPKTKLQSEIAYSNRDVNTFSKLDKGENKGWAIFNRIQRVDTLGKKDWVLKANAMYELKSKNFKAPEQYRPVEFSRDWNMTDPTLTQEHLLNTSMELSNSSGLRTGVGFNFFDRQTLFKGVQQLFHLDYNQHNWNISAQMNWLKSHGDAVKSSFLRPKLDVIKYFPKLKGMSILAGMYLEHNELRNSQTDTLLSSAYYNNNIYAGFKTSDTAAFTGELKYTYRKDFTPHQQDFSSLSTANDLEVSARANKLKNQTLIFNFTFRNLAVRDTTVKNLTSDKNYLGRLEYGFRVKRGAIRFNSIYELGSGQERVREFTYLEVASGQGLYRWLDVNGDGIQQLDEFVISQFSDSANYVRVLTNVNDYVQARTVTYNQVLQLNPKAVWFNEQGFKKFIARFNVSSSILITRKTFKGAKVSPFNPFILNTNDENVLSLNSSFRNSIYFNRGDAKFYMNYTSFINQNKTILVNGFDTRKKNEQTLESNLNLPKGISLNLKLLKGRDFADAEYSTANNYDLGIYNINPSLSWVFKTILRASLGYEFNRKKNIPELGNEIAKGNKLNFSLRYSVASKQTLETKFSFVTFQYNGETGTTKAYQILEGLQPGKNYVWNVEYNRSLSNNLQLTISYDGRKTGKGSRIIHTGSATLRAAF